MQEHNDNDNDQEQDPGAQQPSELFTEYKFDPLYLADLTEQKKKSLKENKGLSDLLGYGLAVVARRLAKDPKRYRDYGPYWWALKDLLVKANIVQGQQSDPLIAREYKGVTPVQTLVAAETFRDQYLQSFFVYSNQFFLSAQEQEFYTLFDPDMELPS